MNNNLNIPIILKEGEYSEDDVSSVRNENKIWKESDIYKLQLEELFEILNPSIVHTNEFKTKLEDFIKSKLSSTNIGNWIYFPWSGQLIHTVNEKDYFSLRTNRNKQIIRAEEQEKLNGANVGFVGLSIGSHFAISLAYSGIANTMKIADFDSLSTSNLNRVRASLADVKTPKIDILSRQIYEINPYAKLKLFPQGLKDDNLEEFLINDKLDLIFEAIDDFRMKIKIRIAAKGNKIPVIMLTNLGDGMLIDVERYDLDNNLTLFNGMIGDTPEEILNSEITEKKKVEYAMRIVGVEHLSGRILESLFEINKSLVGRPQIFSTVSSTGGFAAYLARKLIIDKTLKSGRYYISFDNIMNIPLSSEEVMKGEMYTARLKEDLGL